MSSASTEDPVEDGATFETNAAIKARYAARASGLPALADDSGLEVDALGGGPGVRTRRYAGENATDAENNAKLLRELAGLPPDRRGARYVCVLALALPEDAGPRGGLPCVYARGTCRGRIADAPRGTGGFGYDPIFEPAARAAGRPDARPVEPGREERDLASGPRRAADGADASRRSGSEADDLAPAPRSASSAAPARASRRATSSSPGRSARARAARHRRRLRRRPGRAHGRRRRCGARAGGEVIGVIPQGLVDRELAHPGLTELDIVGTLHERKAGMSELADAFIALPGGLGTLEELAEVASWAQLQLHAKPIGLLEVDGYWASLLAWLDDAVEEGFVAPGPPRAVPRGGRSRQHCWPCSRRGRRRAIDGAGHRPEVSAAPLEPRASSSASGSWSAPASARGWASTPGRREETWATARIAFRSGISDEPYWVDFDLTSGCRIDRAGDRVVADLVGDRGQRRQACTGTSVGHQIARGSSRSGSFQSSDRPW